MRLSLSAFLAVPLLAVPAVAQIPQVGPAVTKWTGGATLSPADEPALSPMAITGVRPSSLQQIELRLVSGTTYRGAATVTGLPVAGGGAGGQDVIEFLYDAQTQIVTSLTTTAALNTGGKEAAFSISEDGLTAVYDGNNGPYWASRASTGAGWQPMGTITGLSVSGNIDSKLFSEGTQLKYAFTAGDDIWDATFNAGSVTNAAIRIPKSVAGISSGSSSTSTSVAPLHLPSPINRETTPGSGNYQVLGWMFNRGSGTTNTWYLPSSDGVTTFTNDVAYEVFATAGRHGGGTFLGDSGTLIVAKPSSNANPWIVPMVAANNATYNAAAGGVVRIRALTEWSSSAPYQTFLCLGPAIGPLPINFAIGNPLSPSGQTAPPPGPLAVIQACLPGIVVPGPNAGGNDYVLPIGPGSIPAGLPVPMQILAIDGSSQVFIGNTCVIEGQ